MWHSLLIQWLNLNKCLDFVEPKGQRARTVYTDTSFGCFLNTTNRLERRHRSDGNRQQLFCVEIKAKWTRGFIFKIQRKGNKLHDHKVLSSLLTGKMCLLTSVVWDKDWALEQRGQWSQPSPWGWRDFPLHTYIHIYYVYSHVSK